MNAIFQGKVPIVYCWYLIGDFSHYIQILLKFVCFYMHVMKHMVSLCLYLSFYVPAYVHKCPCVLSWVVYIYVHTCHMSFMCNCLRTAELGVHGGSYVHPYHPSWHQGCHCAPVMINHVLQRLALFRREGTNHTPHYPGLVTPKRSSPRTPQPVAVWKEKGREQVCVKKGWVIQRNRMSKMAGECDLNLKNKHCENIIGCCISIVDMN